MRWNRLYRSASLAKLSDRGQADLSGLDLALVCDLRRDEERAEAPSRLEINARHDVIGFNIGPSRKLAQIYSYLGSSTATQEDVRGAMCELYRSFVSDFQAEYSQLLRYMLAHERLPMLFHCAAGKDRTGFAAAITLAALGVPRDVIFDDYLLTNELLNFKLENSSLNNLSPELFHVMLSADPQYLAASFEQIDEQYGSFDRYLADGLEVGEREQEILRSNLLE